MVDGQDVVTMLAPETRSLVINGCDPSRITKEYLFRCSKAGIDAVVVTVAIKHDFDAFLQELLSVKAAAADAGAMLIQSVEDLRSEQAGVVLATQNTLYFRDSLDLLHLSVDLGIRVVQLTYNEQNLVGSGCTETRDGGLSDFGRRVVESLQSHGVLIDLSHCGRRTTLEAVEMAHKPVAFTHANSYALWPSPRNRTDEEVRAVARTGGVIGLNAFPWFVGEGAPTVDDLVRHASYLAGLVGAEHLSIGLDFIDGRDLNWIGALGYSGAAYPSISDWPDSYCEGISKPEDIENLRSRLLSSGFDEDEVAGIMGNNLKRVFSEAWTRP